MVLTFIDAGQLTARLDLEAPVEATDGQGGVSVTHTVETSLWARIEPISAASEELGHVRRMVASHRIWTRLDDRVAPGKRFRKGARLFAIETVRDPDETGRFLVCLCREEEA
ncbi:MAG: hypothetical protein RLZZ444_3261 [Pseudomonadota bacterium]|jgi:SPP1 family predicted phage head-tail adaptor